MRHTSTRSADPSLHFPRPLVSAGKETEIGFATRLLLILMLILPTVGKVLPETPEAEQSQAPDPEKEQRFDGWPDRASRETAAFLSRDPAAGDHSSGRRK